MHAIHRSFCILGLALLPAACFHDDGGDGDAGNARIISLEEEAPQAITNADLNEDGDPDIVVAYGSKVGVLLNDGSGDFDETLFNLDDGSRAEAIAIADIDGDGHQDVISANEGSHKISVLLGRGDGRLQDAVSFGAGVTADRLLTVTAGDLNNDGNPDVITLSDAARLSVRLGNGDGTLQPALVFDAAEADNDHLALNLMTMDLNNDNNLDVIAYNTSFDAGDGTMSSLAVMFGNGDGTLQAETRVVDSTRLDQALQVIAADMNNDGRQDLVQAVSQAPLLVNNGDGTFQRDEYNNFCHSLNCRMAGVAAGDMDGDGRLDIATINNRVKTVCDPCDGDHYGYNETLLGSDSVSILLGNGDGTLQQTEIIIAYPSEIAFGSSTVDTGQAIGVDGQDVIAADLDGDDRAEIIAIYNGKLAVFSMP